MKPRNAAQVIIVAGWCTGMILILDGWPFPAGITVLAITAGTAAAVLRWSQPAGAWLTAAAKRLPFRNSQKTGAAVDRT